ncbi:MAG: efflux RND transporter permease subunit [Planctomycetales bacterium]|nr:MAG: efflux RND transporter permease subunit [Planctomycetales bacterium]
MLITRIAVRFPTLTFIAVALLVIWGLGYFFTMSRREDPEITIRTARVITYFPGAMPEDIEQYITKPIEDVAAELSEVSNIESISRFSLSLVIVELDSDTPVEDVAQIWDRLRTKISAIRGTLPDGSTEPVVDDEFFETASHIIAVSGEDYTPRELAAYAERIRKRISLLPAAGRVQIFGEQEERIWLEFDQLRMARYNINLDSLLNSVQGTNVLMPGGEIESEGSRWTIDSSGEFRSLEDIRRLPVTGAGGAGQLRIGDLGDVYYGYEDPTDHIIRVDGKPAVLVSVVMKSGRNVMQLGEQINAELDAIRDSIPGDLELTVVHDQPEQVEIQIGNFLSNLFSGILLVVVIVFLFMGLRTTIPVGLAIPLVLVSCFAVMSLIGTTLQQMSIAGLIIAIGMLVDNAIVVSDNVMRYMEQGIERREAAIQATSELAMPMLSSTLTTLFAFLPLAAMRAESGEFVRDIPVTVSIAILMSYFIALTVTPALCSMLIRPGGGVMNSRPLGPLMNWLEAVYRPVLAWTQRNRIVTGAIVTVTFIGSLAMFPLLGVQFFPSADRNQFSIDLYMPEGTPISETEQAVKAMERVLDQHPGVTTYMASIGRGGPMYYYNRVPGSLASWYGEFLVNTVDRAETRSLVPELRREAQQRVPGANVIIRALEQGPPVGSPIQIKVRGENLEELRGIGNEIQDILADTRDVIDIRDSFGVASRHLELVVDESQLRAIGMTRRDINRVTLINTSGLEVTEYRAPSRTIPVVMRVKGERRDSATDLNTFYLHAGPGFQPVPLSSVAHYESRHVISEISRTDRERELTVSANLANSRLASDALKDIKPRLDALEMAPGYRIVISGEAEESGEAFAGLGSGSVVALLLIILVLVAQFRSIRIAMVVFIAIPLSLIGAILGLYVSGWPFGFTAGLGLISLAGIVVNNSIVLMDFIMERLRQGQDMEEAIVKAGERRLRPIILTTATTIGGLLPLGLWGGSMWAPMAWVIIGGLVVGTGLTLIVVPMIFRTMAGSRALEIVQQDR